MDQLTIHRNSLSGIMMVLAQDKPLVKTVKSSYSNPQAIFKDPFRRGNNILVMCDAYTPKVEPVATNYRCAAAKIFNHSDVVAEEPWYGIEQEYKLLQKDVKWPIGWPLGGYPAPQGPYYCGVGADNAFGRDIADSHYKACLYAGINISGINGEVMPGQWEFQVGPSGGISAGDELWVARYILEAEWNGAGAHTNYSTKSMRSEGGYEVIKKAIEKLGFRHKEHIAAYGEGNEQRLTGENETADIKTFTWGVANRGVSVRVGKDTEKKGKGYLEDRRPASNMDPYVVTSMIAETTLLWKPPLSKLFCISTDDNFLMCGVANRAIYVRVGQTKDRRPASNMDPHAYVVMVTSMMTQTTLLWKP
ncbi:hypothetical protein ACFE04_009525 [Oxalis oulophora]